MTDTTNIHDLFAFLINTLAGEGYALRSSHPELRTLLSQARASQPDAQTVLELDFSIDEFAATLRHLGAGAEFMWPGTTTESAGLRLFLTHIDEQRATGKLRPPATRLMLRDAELHFRP